MFVLIHRFLFSLSRSNNYLLKISSVRINCKFLFDNFISSCVAINSSGASAALWTTFVEAVLYF